MIERILHLKHDDYVLLEQLGGGNQGEVWKVRRQRDDALFAMKIVRITRPGQTGRLESISSRIVGDSIIRLQNEIEFLRSLDQPEACFIVPCIDYGSRTDKDYGKLPIMVMPFYQQTLEKKMPPYPHGILPPNFSQCLRWVEQMAIALETTHNIRLDGETAFLHRDFKAANMMLTDDGNIRLIDFGISRTASLEGGTGTHSYSPESGAPEQILTGRLDVGKSLYFIGTHSDMYAMGSVVYRLFMSAHTEAQEQLNLKDVQDQHIQKLSRDGHGYLGEIGGLSHREYRDLCNEIERRLNAEDLSGSGTLIAPVMGGLPDNALIAASFADFVRELLHADYKQRPTAQQARRWVETLQQALQPELHNLTLALDTARIKAGQSAHITLHVSGKGLPAQDSWLHLDTNGKSLKKGITQLPPQVQHFGFANRDKVRWGVSVMFPSAGKYTLKASAQVNGYYLQDEAILEVAGETQTKPQRTSVHTEKAALSAVHDQPFSPDRAAQTELAAEPRAAHPPTSTTQIHKRRRALKLPLALAGLVAALLLVWFVLAPILFKTTPETADNGQNTSTVLEPTTPTNTKDIDAVTEVILRVPLDFDELSTPVIDGSNGMVLARQGQRWGMIDFNGDWLVQPRFSELQNLKESWAMVQLNDQYWNFLNANHGGFLSMERFDEVAPFYDDGFAAVKKKGKWGFVNLYGDLAIKPRYRNARRFSEGVAPVQLFSRKWGYVDTQGNLVIPAQFDFAYSFSEGLAVVQVGDRRGFINHDGEYVVKPKYKRVKYLQDGLAPVRLSERWGYINTLGKEVIPRRYQDARPFREGLSPVQLEDQWGYIDTKGHTVIEMKYDLTYNFSDGFAMVKKNDKIGYIDVFGNEVVPLEYDDGYRNQQGLISVKKGQQWGLLEIKNPYAKQWVIEESHARRLEHSDLFNLSAVQLRLAREEIYARHGVEFDDKFVQLYFQRMPWYQMDREGQLSLSDIEEDNLNLIRQEERER